MPSSRKPDTPVSGHHHAVDEATLLSEPTPDPSKQAEYHQLVQKAESSQLTPAEKRKVTIFGKKYPQYVASLRVLDATPPNMVSTGTSSRQQSRKRAGTALVSPIKEPSRSKKPRTANPGPPAMPATADDDPTLELGTLGEKEESRGVDDSMIDPSLRSKSHQNPTSAVVVTRSFGSDSESDAGQDLNTTASATRGDSDVTPAPEQGIDTSSLNGVSADPMRKSPHTEVEQPHPTDSTLADPHRTRPSTLEPSPTSDTIPPPMSKKSKSDLQLRAIRHDLAHVVPLTEQLIKLYLLFNELFPMDLSSIASSRLFLQKVFDQEYAEVPASTQSDVLDDTSVASKLASTVNIIRNRWAAIALEVCKDHFGLSDQVLANERERAVMLCRTINLAFGEWDVVIDERKKIFETPIFANMLERILSTSSIRGCASIHCAIVEGLETPSVREHAIGICITLMCFALTKYAGVAIQDIDKWRAAAVAEPPAAEIREHSSSHVSPPSISTARPRGKKASGSDKQNPITLARDVWGPQHQKYLKFVHDRATGSTAREVRWENLGEAWVNVARSVLNFSKAEEYLGDEDPFALRGDE
ncbi:hypothetical protein DL93DRAFT_2152713 [Clavulina sp. PMI_390]|nr:hypothetical protein DL93DRAFT_2152713 [Clavulina sp. PMI_390]